MSANLHDLARKLMELAKRGVGGEAVNAETMLHRLLKKHNITLEELENEQPIEREFRFTSKEHRSFIIQCIASVLGEEDRQFVRYRGRRGVFYAPLTTAEHLECIIKAEHYWPLLQTELRRFRSAFIQANGLARKVSSKQEQPELTPEELEELRRVMQLMDAAKVASPTRRLERGEKLTA